MDSAAVAAALDCLDAAGVHAIVDGGWGIDALIGEQTRPHDDLDLMIELDHAADATTALAALGFAVTVDASPTRVVVAAPDDRRVDLHLVTLATDALVQQLPPSEGSVFRYPIEGTRAAGRIGARPVTCLTAAAQVLVHCGYDPDDGDRADLARLRVATGTSLPPPYTCSRPTEVEVRTATGDDAAAMAVVRHASWRAAYRELIDQSILDALDVGAAWRFLGAAAAGQGERECVLVAGGPGEVVAFAVAEAARDTGEPDSTAELSLIYADPSAWGTGAGHVLLTEVVRRLEAAGYSDVLLWTLRDNVRARRFYEAHGWQADGGEKADGPVDRQWTDVRYRLALT